MSQGRLIGLLRSSTFRFGVLYFALFASSVVVLLGFIYWQTVIYARQQQEETIDAEITGLSEQYRQAGLTGLVEIIHERADPTRGSTMLYLLVDAQRVPLAGNLARWPDATIDDRGWMQFALKAEDSRHRPHLAQATSFLLPGGYQLLVGRDLSEGLSFRNRITNVLGWSGGASLLLGILCAAFLGRRVLTRLETISRTGESIMAGHFAQRIPLTGSGDEFDRLSGTLNAMLDRIQQLMDGMRQVTDNIAHDLRSPLGRLRSRMEMVLMEPPSIPAYSSALQSAIEEADRLLGTFTALLDIAEAESGGVRALAVRLDAAELARDLADLYEPVAEEAGLRFATRIDGPCFVDGDRHLLSRALSNLIENAMKYTPPGGDVTLECRPDGQRMRLVVADSGPGIPASERERVFDRFYRLETSRTTDGNGLGLSLVRAAVLRHNGEVRLEDAEPGLRAVIFLPAARIADAISTAQGRAGDG